MSRTYRQKRLWVQHSGPPADPGNYNGREVYAVGTDGPFNVDARDPRHIRNRIRRQAVKKAKAKQVERRLARNLDPPVDHRNWRMGWPQQNVTTRVRRGVAVTIPAEWRGWTTSGQRLARRKSEARFKRKDTNHDRNQKKMADHVAPLGDWR
jgi:hypothetical protein